MQVRVCYVCGLAKPLTGEFWHNKKSRGKSNFQMYCKSCTTAHREMYPRDPEKLRAAALARYATLPKEYGRDQMRRFRKANPDYFRIKSQNARRNSARGFVRGLMCAVKQRCRKYGLPCDIDTDYIISLLSKQGGLCAITGDSLTMTVGEGFVKTNLSIDQIRPGSGYVRGNVQLVCYYANIMKNDWTMEELREICLKILGYSQAVKAA